MTRHLCYQNGTGLGSQPAGQLRFSEVPAGVTPAAHRQAIEASDPTLLQGTYLGVFQDAERPASRRFRDAWRMVAGQIVVDVGLARDRRKKEVRHEGLQRIEPDDDAVYRAAVKAAVQQANADLNGISTLSGLANYNPVWPERT